MRRAWVFAVAFSVLLTSRQVYAVPFTFTSGINVNVDVAKIVELFGAEGFTAPAATPPFATEPGFRPPSFQLGFSGGAVNKDGSLALSFKTDPPIWSGSLAFSQNDVAVVGNDRFRVIGQVQHVAAGFPGDTPFGSLVHFTVSETDPEHDGLITHVFPVLAPHGRNSFEVYLASLSVIADTGLFQDDIDGWTFSLQGTEVNIRTPEPGTFLLLATGAAVLGGARHLARRRGRRDY